MTRDVTEFLASYDMGPPKRWSSLRVAYHSACSMQHGQRIIRGAAQAAAQRRLHRGRGAGGPPVLRLGRHLQHPAARRSPPTCATARSPTSSACAPDVVATGNIGCITQLAGGMDIPIAHTVELLDWAYGGPVPRGLEALAEHVQDVPEAKAGPGAKVRRTKLSQPRLGERSLCASACRRRSRSTSIASGMTPGERARGRRARARGVRRDDAAARQGISDEDYQRGRRQDRSRRRRRCSPSAELIVKVKEPQPPECAHAARGPDALHLSAPGARSRADRRR